MAIVKMRAVTISGRVDEFDKMVEKYVYDRDIHLENAMSVMTDRTGLKEFKETNEYESVVRSISSVLKVAGIDNDVKELADETTDLQQMREYVRGINERIDEERQSDDELRKQVDENSKAIEDIRPMLGAKVDFAVLNKMQFVTYGFGHLPKTSYKTLVTYLDDTDTFFVKTTEDEKDVWGFWFAPTVKLKKIKEMYNSLYFEDVEIPENYTGSPDDIFERLTDSNEELMRKIKKNSEKTAKLIESSKQELCKIQNLARRRQNFSNIRKKAMHSKSFFFIVGWMDEKGANKLEKEITASNDALIFYQEPPEKAEIITPPTKLKNNFVFKPFEMFVKMYGLPDYEEIDPTPILAITYILFFGIMFGDVGQSLILSAAGFIMYKVKKMQLGGIVGWVGISGAIFGFIYGSVFGNEEIIPTLFHTFHLRPMEQIGLMLGGTIGIGVLVIIFGMVLNMINLIKEHKFGECIFNHNGLCGIVFYVSILLLAGNMLLGLHMPNILFVALIILSVIIMYLEEPLSHIADGDKNYKINGGMFFVESFFELFEVILSFFSNTISFLRIGAFAIVHVGMMQVVAVLAASGGVSGVIVQIIGNIIVMCLEGLVVGIQVLRLEYYEMFSRYFSGRGKEFNSLRIK